MSHEQQRMHVIPIEPESGLFLAPYQGQYLQKGGTEAYVVMRGFSQIFRQTWLRIPARDRQLMRIHWNTFGSSDHPLKRYAQSGCPECVSPCIVVTDQIPHAHRSGVPFMGYCDHDGHVLLFRADWVAGDTEQRLMRLVGHELAHVFRLASGDDNKLDLACDAEKAQTVNATEEELRTIVAKYQQQNEEETDRVANGWGFYRIAI